MAETCPRCSTEVTLLNTEDAIDHSGLTIVKNARIFYSCPNCGTINLAKELFKKRVSSSIPTESAALKQSANRCGACKKFRSHECPRREYRTSELNRVACISSDSACEEYEPDKKKIRYKRRAFRKAVEAIQ